MKRWFTKPLVIIAILVGFARGAHSAGGLDQLESAVDAWQFGAAEEIVSQLPEKQMSSPRGQFLLGKLMFFQGDFEGAQTSLGTAIGKARAEFDWKYLRNRARDAGEVLSAMSQVKGASGRFVYRFAASEDAVLIPYAEATLNRQAEALEKFFGDRPPFAIEVVFVPDLESLSRSTGLTAEQIERTGTVGVTKWGRITLVTPRKLAFGYPWLDTLAHELTHVSIIRKSKGRAPVWLHEGIAKFLEKRWAGVDKGQLTPQEAYLLDMAARQGRLIPLRSFHPSVAHLPNQEDAALAYAQVLSFLTYLDSRQEPGWIGALLEQIAGGLSVNQAIAKSSPSTLGKLYRWWMQEVSGRRQTPVPAVGIMKRKFKRGQTTSASDAESVLSVEVRRHLRIGDLLRQRGHTKAAAKEYDKATELNENLTPEIADRLAGALLDLKRHKRVAEILPEMTDLYPAHTTSFVQLGQALAALDKTEKATAVFEHANALNPFDPVVHCTLKELYPKLDRPAEAERESNHCRLLMGGGNGGNSANAGQ